MIRAFPPADSARPSPCLYPPWRLAVGHNNMRNLDCAAQQAAAPNGSFYHIRSLPGANAHVCETSTANKADSGSCVPIPNKSNMHVPLCRGQIPVCFLFGDESIAKGHSQPGNRASGPGRFCTLGRRKDAAAGAIDTGWREWYN